MGRHSRRQALKLAGAALVATGAAPAGAERRVVAADVCIYGGTAGGVAAAVHVSRMGRSAVILEFGRRLGGLTAGGLGQTDIGNKAAIGGLSRTFYDRVLRYYTERYGPDSQQVKECTGGFRFEPSVAERLMEEWVREAAVPVHREQRLKGVRRRGNRIVEIEMESGLVCRARVFLDCTYEGDLMARAGVSYHVGREANAVYGETLNGIQFGHRGHRFQVPVDPYVVEGDPASGLLKGVTAEPPGSQGEGDRRVQAYNFRMCLTDDPANMLPFPKPDGYDPERYTLLARYLSRGFLEIFGNHKPMPNRKSDTNNHGAFGTDNIGMSHDYPEGDYAARERIFREHVTYQQGLMWFLANDERVPPEFRERVRQWGLAKDEFVETGGWPHQLYVREARRMIGAYVMTEHNCRGAVKAEDPVGLGAYNMDSHHVRRIVIDGAAVNEGDVQVPVAPYPISYRALVPREAECTNLLVPVCLSASHIAYGSIRMEPVFMILGESAATAACLAIQDGVPVQQVDYGRLRAKLLESGQVLEWTGPAAPDPYRAPLIDRKSLKGIVLDDEDGVKTGYWERSAAAAARRVGTGYVHDGNANKGGSSIAYTPDLPEEREYEVFLISPPHENRATNVPVTLAVNGGIIAALNVSQRLTANNGFTSLGRFRLPGGKAVTVTVSNGGTDGYVVADGVQFVPL